MQPRYPLKDEWIKIDIDTYTHILPRKKVQSSNKRKVVKNTDLMLSVPTTIKHNFYKKILNT